MKLSELSVGQEFTFIDKVKAPVLSVKITNLVWGIFTEFKNESVLLDVYCVRLPPDEIDVFPTGKTVKISDPQMRRAKVIEYHHYLPK